MYQIDGALAARCGSFASRGLPLTVRLPLTTQLLLAWADSNVPTGYGTDGLLRFSTTARGFVVSVPTSTTSSGEVSGNSAARTFSGNAVMAARIKSLG